MAVWDTVLLNDELDLLELRLRVLGDVVDRFVVVEADRTFTGAPKPLHLRDNLERFSQWRGQLDAVVARLDADAPTPWSREHAQERAQKQALGGLGANDLLLVGDVDEIPHPHVVGHLAQHLDEPVRLVMRHALYRGNWVLREPWEEGTVAGRGTHLPHRMIAHSLGEVPESWEGYQEPLLPEAGWHFSYLGGTQDLLRKLDAFSHQELNTSRDRSPRSLEQVYRYQVDLTGRRLLDVTPVVDLDRVQTELLDLRPDWFDFSPRPSPLWRRRGARTWMWARRSPRLPDRVVRAGDRLVGSRALGVPVLAGLALADGLREVRRRRRPSPVSWKRGRWLEPVPVPPAS